MAPRPKPIELDQAVVRPVRPPTPADPRWYWRATRRGGERETVWTGRATRDQARAVVAALVAGGLPERRLDGAPPDCETVRDLLEYYIGDRQGREDLRARSREAAEHAARRLVRTVGQVRLTQLSGRTLEEHRDASLRQGYSTGTIGLDWTILRAALRWGRSRGLVDSQLQADRPRLAHRPARARYTPTAAEVEQLVATLPAGTWQRMAVLLLAETGARRDEVLCLRWDQVDLRRAELVEIGTKTGRTRTIPLRREVAAELRTWRLQTPGELVLGEVSSGAARTGARRALAAACRRLGLPAISPQALRRAREEQLVAAGVPVHVFAALLGHSPAVALRYYLAPRPDQLRAAIEGPSTAHTSARTPGDDR